MSDDYEAFDDDLDPQMFMRGITSSERVDIAAHQFYSKMGDGNSTKSFQMFMWTHLQSVRLVAQVNSKLSHKVFPTVFILANKEESRLFFAQSGESKEDFHSRVRGESTQMNAHWFFGAMEGTAHVGHSLDAEDPEQQQQLKKLKGSIPVINWYAEQSEPDPLAEYGFINISDPGYLVYAGTDLSGSSPYFRHMLN